ncbi:hypothetical protein [Halomonas sp. DQ26W]|uniref:hypothetical protein n=1 Tax=Halomonas sp. DQ26W TaxID=2282311 RepID=UPI0011C03DD0|nr:hypothetical protein [Halomonas sp. DQ26W]
MYFRKLMALGFSPMSSTVLPTYRSSRLEDVCRAFMPWENRSIKGSGDASFAGKHQYSWARPGADLTARAACHGIFR